MRATLGFLIGLVILAALSWISYASGWLKWPHADENLIPLLGIFISGFAFLFAAYFAVIAVSAYGHIRDIEEKSSSARRLHDEAVREFESLRATIENTKGQGQHFLKYLSDAGGVISEFMTSVDSQSGERVRELHLAIKRYTFHSSLSELEKFDAARELVELGEKEDLESVEKFLVLSKSADAQALLRVVRGKLSKLSEKDHG